jgi:hypothetical protein
MTFSKILPSMALALIAGQPSAWATPPQAPGWTTNKIGAANDQRGAWSSLATTDYRCTGANGVSETCHRIGIAYYDIADNSVRYSTSLDGGAHFSTTAVGPLVTADWTSGGIALGYRGATPLIAYQSSYYAPGNLRFAQKVADGTGNCGGNNWKCQNVTGGGYDVRMVVAADGKVTLVSRSSNLRLEITSSVPPYTQWNHVNVVGGQATGTIPATSVAIALDASDTPHISWTGDGGVFHSQSPFTTVYQVDNEYYQPWVSPIITMAFDDDGDLYLAYALQDGVRIAKRGAPLWTKTTITTFGPDERFKHPQIIIQDDGVGIAAIIGAYYEPDEDSILAELHPSQPGAPWTLVQLANHGGLYASASRLFSGEIGVAHWDIDTDDLLFSR